MTDVQALVNRYRHLMAEADIDDPSGNGINSAVDAKFLELQAMHGEHWYNDVAVINRFKDVCDAIDQKLTRDGKLSDKDMHGNLPDEPPCDIPF